MKKILIPIDFSSGSINALEHALEFAKNTDAEVEILHVKKSKDFHIPDYFKDTNIFYGTTAKDYLRIIAETYKDKIKTDLKYTVKQGKVYKTICNFAKKNETSLIIMGAHGISGFEKYYLGSNAYKVVSHADCPVLTIRSTYLKKKVKKIILPIDITTETRQKVPTTVTIAKYFDAEIHILSVSETSSEAVVSKLENYASQVEEYIASRDIKVVKDALIGSNITEVTIEYAINTNANLISIMTEQAESTRNIWMGKYAQQMVNMSPIPVLSFKTKK